MLRRDEDNRAAKAFRAPRFTLRILCGLKMRLLIKRMTSKGSEQRLCAPRRVKKQFLTRHCDRRQVKEPNSLSS